MASIPTTQSTPDQRVETLEEQFQRLAAAWRRDTAHLSSIDRSTRHPAYQAIIALGPAVLPLLLRDLAATRDHWFVALEAITGDDPVPPDVCGRMDRIAEAWLEWGRHHGYSVA